MSIYFPPVQIDATTDGTQQTSTFFGAYQTYGPWLVNGNLYTVLMPLINSGTAACDAWKSTDGGQTWTRLDAANAPQGGYMTPCFDGDHTMTVAMTTVASVVGAPVNAVAFDCHSETWGAPVLSGFSDVGGPMLLIPLPNGDKLFVYSVFGVVQDVVGAIFSSGAWGPELVLDTNMLAAMVGNEGAQLGPFAICDPATGTTHLFVLYADGAFTFHLFYQAIASDGTLGSFFEFPDVLTVLNTIYGTPCIVGNTLVFPVQTLDGSGNNRTGVYIGTGLASPVWQLFADIDPIFPGSASGRYVAAFLIGGAVQIVDQWPTGGGTYPNGLVRISETTDFVTWVFTSATAYDVDADGPPSFQLSGNQFMISAALSDQGLALSAFPETGTLESSARYFFQSLAGPSGPTIACATLPNANIGAPYSYQFPVSGGTLPYAFSIAPGFSLPSGLNLDPATGIVSGTPLTVGGPFPFTVTVTDANLQTDSCATSVSVEGPNTPSVPIPGGGPASIRGSLYVNEYGEISAACPRPINRYDLCAEQEVWRLKRIHFPPSCNIPKNLGAWDEEAMPIPAGARPFNIQGTIVTPATAAGDVLVCQAQVPTGYDALLSEIYQIYQGSGFSQGSGDIVWRIRRNQIWLKALGNMPYSLGSFKNLVLLTEGEIILSGSVFSYFVNVPNLSGMIQVGASKISCGMRGFYWPRG